jgi:hypothetical protein
MKEMEGEETYDVLEALNKIIGGYGVESSRDEYNPHWDSYYTDFVVEYVNMGDTYNPTICYDIVHGEYVLASWGDVWEQYEQERDEYYMEEAERKFLNQETGLGSTRCWEIRRDSDMPTEEEGRECDGFVSFIADKVEWNRDERNGVADPKLIGRYICSECGEEYLETEGITVSELEAMQYRRRKG